MSNVERISLLRISLKALVIIGGVAAVAAIMYIWLTFERYESTNHPMWFIPIQVLLFSLAIGLVGTAIYESWYLHKRTDVICGNAGWKIVLETGNGNSLIDTDVEKSIQHSSESRFLVVKLMFHTCVFGTK